MDTASSEWMSFRFGHGINPYVGMSMTGGPIIAHVGDSFSSVEGSYAWEINAGVMFKRFELGFHFSPVTFKGLSSVPDPQLSALITAGGYIRITDNLSWPMRGGAGVVAVNTGGNVLPQFQMDVVGLAYHLGHVTFEAEAPSFRFASLFGDLDSVLFLSWHFGVKTTYAF